MRISIKSQLLFGLNVQNIRDFREVLRVEFLRN